VSLRDRRDRIMAHAEAMKSVSVTQDSALTWAIHHVFFAEAIQKDVESSAFTLNADDGPFQAHTTLARVWSSIAMQLKDYPEGICASGDE
jgi:2'-5' RNA ligase